MPVETGPCLLAALGRFAFSLADAEAELNAMNVFPIADRDTGTNLRRTLERLVVELEGVDPAGPLGPAVVAAGFESARGNSGLICSQYLSSFVEAGDTSATLDGPTLVNCLQEAALAARTAVAEPVEGTMLTVADAVADEVREAGCLAPAEIAVKAERRSREALAETTSQLDVLAEAGVVDAGAAGLVLFFAALVAAIESGTGSRMTPLGIEGSIPGTGDGRFVGYELQFTADGPRSLADELRTLLTDLGTDVVVSSAHDLIRVHVHTVALGPLMEAVIDRVRPRNIMIEPLMESTET